MNLLQSIVGWYSFRRNSSLRPSYRERMIHASLVKTFSLDSSTCTLLLCSEKSKTNQSTHVFDHCFLHQQDRYEKLHSPIVSRLKKKVECHKKLSKIISLYIRSIQQLIYIELKSTTDDYLHVGHGLSLIILISNICEINFKRIMYYKFNCQLLHYDCHTFVFFCVFFSKWK